MDITFNTCTACGGSQVYNPDAASLVCTACGSTNALELTRESRLQKLDYRDNWTTFADMTETGGETEDVRSTTCTGCGAEISIESGASSGTCGFCGTTVTTDAAPHPALLPHYVTPFQVSRDTARSSFRNWLTKRKFAPTKLKEFARQDDPLRGVYFPCWTFDADTMTHYRGQRGRNRTVTQKTKDSDGKTKQTSKTVTDWTNVSGTVTHAFRDLVVAANDSLPEKLVDRLNLDSALEPVKYDRSLLAGFQAESYSHPVDHGFRRAQKTMERKIRELIRRDIGGDQQRIDSLQTTESNRCFAYVLVPIWALSYRFKNKTYRVLVNGKSGTVVGERPYSIWKILRLILGILAAGGLAYLAYYLLQLYGVI